MTQKLNINKAYSDTVDRMPAGNSGLAKGGLTCFVETFVQIQTFVLRMNFSAKNPALRQAAKRYAQCKKYKKDNATFDSYFASLQYLSQWTVNK